MTAEYTKLLNNALEYHKSNDFVQAEKLYKILLEAVPDNVNVLNLYGLLCLAKGDTETAISLLSKAMILNSESYIISNLAKAYYMSGNYEKAITLYKQAVDNEPSDDIYYSMAIAYKKLGNIPETIACYNKALEFNPNNFSVIYNLANLYKDINDYKNSLNFALRAELINQNDEDVQTLLATLFENQKKYKKSITHLERAFNISPKYIYLYNMAVLYAKLKDEKKAITLYSNVLAINPLHVESLVNLASIYRNIDLEKSLYFIKKAYEITNKDEIVILSLAQIYKDLYKNGESISCLKELLLTKNSAEAYSLLGMNYMDLQQYDEALLNYNKALEINPNNLDYYHGKAMALKYLGKLDEARILMEYIVNKGDTSMQSITTLGMLYLQEKNFKKGMELYIRRSEDTKFANIFKTNVWNNTVSLNNKTVLLYSDCGLGDTIMFARYIPNLQEIAGKVILQTDKELVSILAYNYPSIQVIAKTDKLPDFDVVLPIMNIAYALNCDFTNIPFSDGYLNQVKKNYDFFKQNKLNIGIFYQGNKKVFKNRSIPYEKLCSLFKLENVNFYSFQLDNFECEDENVLNLKDYISDYADTASLLLNLDLMITIDSSIAHMSGALGVKTFLLLPHTAEWRWFNDTEITPWYKSIRIFKQPAPMDWDSVVNKIKDELISYENK